MCVCACVCVCLCVCQCAQRKEGREQRKERDTNRTAEGKPQVSKLGQPANSRRRQQRPQQAAVLGVRGALVEGDPMAAHPSHCPPHAFHAG
jgi:hypothetical protein